MYLTFRFLVSLTCFMRFAIQDFLYETWNLRLAISTSSKICKVKLAISCKKIVIFHDYSVTRNFSSSIYQIYLKLFFQIFRSFILCLTLITPGVFSKQHVKFDSCEFFVCLFVFWNLGIVIQYWDFWLIFCMWPLNTLSNKCYIATWGQKWFLPWFLR